jgi:hypothetical protein
VTEQEPGDSELEYEDEPPAATPFDNPYFLPVVLWGLAAWFGYDVVTDSEAYRNYPVFNLGGFGVLSVLAIYFTRSAILEKRALRENDSDAPTDPPPPIHPN